VNQQQSLETEFAQRLRTELKAIVVERGAALAAEEATRATTAMPLWRRPRLALGGAAATATVAAAMIVSAGGGGTPAAYAVEPQPEGMISVEIRSLEDARGLEEALGEVGIRASVDYLATGMACKEPRFQPVPPPGGRAFLISKIGSDGKGVPEAFVIDRDAIDPDKTLVITASPNTGTSGDGHVIPAGDYLVQMEVAQGSVAPCEPVPAPVNSGG
jgi:hypothetical protein